MKKLVVILFVGIAIISSIVGLKGCSGSDAIKVTTEKAVKRTIIETVTANGKIQPEIEVKISSDVSGEIVELLVKEGDFVKKGDLLIRIKPDIYVSNLDRMKAALDGSKANTANSKARLAQVKSQFVNIENTFVRNKKLVEQGAISQADFDASKSAYEAAKADIVAAEETVNAAEFSVKSSEAALKEASDNLAKTNIYSPVNGTVSKLSVELGERVVGTSQMAGTELLRLANLNEMEVSVDVNENDIVRVSLNDTVSIEVDAYVDRKFKGIVTEIANSANTLGLTADQVTNFVVKIRVLSESYADLINPKFPNESPFRPGMSAGVDIQTQIERNVLSVPIQAVTTRTDSTSYSSKKKEAKKEEKEKEADKEQEELEVTSTKEKKQEKSDTPFECVFVMNNGKSKLIPVKTGIQDNEYIQITAGLKEGDEVIAGPYSAVSKVLRNGSVVALDKESENTDKK
ncbi:MAG: efflux RND transporter periplasmic adaptor subunit [Bacteroidetes bacterium]|nr:efflux RND transporter periplasmic adaptor subunit [Bacteroidota bacterium]